MKITPTITLFDIFGPNHLYTPRLSNYGYMPKDPPLHDLLTGTNLGVVGKLPTLCSQAVISNRSLDAYQAAGIMLPTEILSYRDEAEYETLLQSLAQQDIKMVFHSKHSPKKFPLKKYWVNAELLSFLNNKGNLHRIAPAEQIPKRRLLNDMNPSSIDQIQPPVVVKLATDRPTGSGCDIAICKDRTSLEKALKEFVEEKQEKVVIEEYLNIVRNYCLHYAITVDKELIGASEPVNDETGYYQGNWVDPIIQSPPKAALQVGDAVMQKAKKLDYYGVAGLDMALLDDGQVLVYDLNFRMNGSTPAVLLYKSLVDQYKKDVFRYVSWSYRGETLEFFHTIYSLIDEKRLLPLSIFDPPKDVYLDPKPMFSGLLMGNSREEVASLEIVLRKEQFG